MATTSTQQTNGANTLIVSSSLIPFSSSASQLSSVNTSALAGTHQPSLITTTQNQLAQQQPFLQVFNPHDFQLQQLYQQQMFLPQASLTTLQQQQQQQQNSIQAVAAAAAANEQAQQQQLAAAVAAAAAKKKVNKIQKIVSKTSNQLHQPATSFKSTTNLLAGQPQFTTHQSNQAVVISQLPTNVLHNSQQTINNKKTLDSQKGKQILIQNNAISQQSLVGSQFKPAQLQGLTQQSPHLINQTQLIAPLQQIPQSSLAWAQPNQNQQLVPSSPQIIIRQPPHTSTDAQQVFIQNSNPTLQAMPSAPFYVNPSTGGLMQLVSNHTQSHLNPSVQHHHQQQPILQTSTHSAATTNSVVTSTPNTGKLKAIKPASSISNLNSSSQSFGNISNCSVTPKAVKSQMSGEKKVSKKEQIALDKAAKNLAFKSTQQMNAELLARNEKKQAFQRSDSMKSLDSLKSKSEFKTLKKSQSSSLDDDSSNSLSNHTNGSLKKSEKKVKQRAIVKPQILSHCVDGYIIHESSFPFPINVTEELNDELEQIKLNNSNHHISTGSTEKVKSKKLKKLKQKASQQSPMVTAPSKANNQPISNLSSSPAFDIPIGTVLPASAKQERNKPLVNVEKEIETNISLQKKDQDSMMSQSQNSNTIVGNKEKKINVVSVAPISESASSSGCATLDDSNVFSWSKEQVYDYLIKQDVSDAIAKELLKAQIDGKSLTLLTIPILKDKFGFKLGPILSFKKKIDELKNKSANIPRDEYVPASGENIKDWSVKDAYQFILHLSSKEHAEEFERQEMDGASLMLISTDNIVNDMNIPFGPALTIYSRIEELKKNSTN